MIELLVFSANEGMNPSTLWLFLAVHIAAMLIAAEPPITALAFAPDGESVAACSQAGLHVYRWPSLELIRTSKANAANLHCLQFSPNGKQLAVGGGDPAEIGTVELFNWPDCESITTFGNHADSVHSIAWVSETRLFSASADFDIKLWHVTDAKQPILDLKGHSRAVNALCLMPDGKTLVSAGADHSLRVWNVADKKLIRSLNQHSKAVNALAVRPGNEDLPMVASASSDRTIRFWQPTIGRMVRYIRLEAEPLCIAWFNDSEHCAAACVDGKVRIINADDVAVTQTMKATTGWAYAVAVHPNDNGLVVGGSNGEIRRFNPFARQE